VKENEMENVKIEVRVTEAELDKYIGTECEEYQEGCCVCETWREWEENEGVISIEVDRDELVSWLIIGE